MKRICKKVDKCYIESTKNKSNKKSIKNIFIKKDGCEIVDIRGVQQNKDKF